MNKKIYIVGIGGIGVSAIARYYLYQGYEVYGSDSTHSQLIEELEKEGCNIYIGERADFIEKDIEQLVYSEAIPEENTELQKAKEIGIKTRSYPQSLGEITKQKKLIGVAGTHGKSTTTTLISLILKNSGIRFGAIVGTLLKEFNEKNFFYRNSPLPLGEGLGVRDKSEYFVIEACEYKRSLLNYQPSVAVITNIELDHLDYYKNLDDYINAFEEYINNVHPGGFVILNGNDENSQKLLGKRKDISYIEVYDEYFSFGNEKIEFPKIEMQLPGKHILFDAHIGYIIGHMVGIPDNDIIQSLKNYSGAWRRMEIIGETQNGNTLMSDYAHHPTEIELTLKSLKEKYPSKKIFTLFQPHQYSRTLELLGEFKNCFGACDSLIIPDIYESRDSEEDKQKINSQKLVELIKHSNKQDGKGLENTLKLTQEYDKRNPNSSIILLLGAGDLDNLRYKIETV